MANTNSTKVQSDAQIAAAGRAVLATMATAQKSIGDNVVESVGFYHAMGVAFNEGGTLFDNWSMRNAAALAKVSFSFVQRGAAIATKYPTAAAAKSAFTAKRVPSISEWVSTFKSGKGKGAAKKLTPVERTIRSTQKFTVAQLDEVIAGIQAVRRAKSAADKAALRLVS